MRCTPLAALLLAATPPALSAQGWIEIERPVGPTRNSPAITRVSSNVHVTVDGRVAKFEVEERFRNTGGGIAEGTYLYPLPGEAVFSDFSLFQGEKELKGEMMNAEQARTIYEGIVRRLKDPALLTLAGHGLIRAQVFPVQPGETRTVILRFTQLLARDGDALRLRYAAGDRGDAPVTVGIDVAREREFATTYSPSHPITQSRRDGTLHISVTPPVRGDIDLVLPFRRGLIGGTVLTHAEPGEDGFALLFLAPPAAEENAVVARDLTFVVDISGSMSGEKMEQAKRAVHQALRGLRTGDRFRVIAFSSAVRQFREGFTAVTSASLREANGFVDALNPNGGTNLEGAIDAALAVRADPERMALVFLLTDGIPSVGEQAPDRIAAGASAHIGRTRIFTVGVGQDVNTYLLDRLAVEGRGSATYVAPGADVGDAVGGVMTRMSHPALVDLRIVDAPVRFLDEAPAVLPDLFYGEELVVLARYRGEGNGPVVIEGTRNGRRERFTVTGEFTRHNAGNDYIAPLWAARRIGELSRQLRLEGSSPRLIAQIRDLGLRYGILTEYTSYLVQEPGTLASAPPAPAVGGAMAAREMTGQRAFDAAKASASMSGSNTLAAANRAVEARMDQVTSKQLVDGRSVDEIPGQLRRAGGRIFSLRNGVWTDAGARDSLKVISVAPFSRAYFDLVAARPALAEALGVGTPLLLGGSRASLKVADGGVSEWAPGALERFLREFEGR
ncbi:MAG: VIT domain-containing protein [Gemmatimonadota bacterium]